METAIVGVVGTLAGVLAGWLLERRSERERERRRVAEDVERRRRRVSGVAKLVQAELAGAELVLRDFRKHGHAVFAHIETGTWDRYGPDVAESLSPGDFITVASVFVRLRRTNYALKQLGEQRLDVEPGLAPRLDELLRAVEHANDLLAPFSDLQLGAQGRLDEVLRSAREQPPG